MIATGENFPQRIHHPLQETGEKPLPYPTPKTGWLVHTVLGQNLCRAALGHEFVP